MRKFALYGLNGVANTIGSYVVFVLLAQLLDYRIAIVIGYGFGMLTSYLLNGAIVFRVRGNAWRFAVVNLSLLALNLALTWTLVEATDARAEVAQLAVIPIVFVIGFVLNRELVFKQNTVKKS